MIIASLVGGRPLGALALPDTHVGLREGGCVR